MRFNQSIHILAALLLVIMLSFVFQASAEETSHPADGVNDSRIAIILEVEGDPSEHADYVKTHFPYVEVVQTFHKLFNGIALKGKAADLAKMEKLVFIKGVHPVVTYKAVTQSSQQTDMDAVIPSSLNHTEYTGKGVKVGIVDTGIDYHHPDLAGNFAGGYDLVDLDKDPMETLPSQGIPTLHGTHVAGIIAADGKIKGVAPDAEIHSYRALGPGGSGTSIQVIAALEQAVDDGVDVINLSLGNDVNGPDYPTSAAVNKAVDLGVAVVIANGNSGPDNWTVGSPATATHAMSVGALAMPYKIPYLYDPASHKKLDIYPMAGAPKWQLDKDYAILNGDKSMKNAQGKIVLMQRGKVPFYEMAKQAEAKGAIAVLIYNNKKGVFSGSVNNEDNPLTIPAASISKQEGEQIIRQLKEHPLYAETKYRITKEGIADFSSRGPVTINWHIKPDVIAPGVNILSTIPGGKYQKLQGTSMAAPHVTGAMALLKQAHPDWTIKQMEGALKTTAQPLRNQDGKLFDPIIQGMGEIRPKQAINTETIIYNPLLSYGKVKDYKETQTIKVKIENTTNDVQQYFFSIPKIEKGLHWDLPKTFTLQAHEKKTIPVTLNIVTQQLEKGLYQGYLTLNQADTKYQLPYLFMNKTADYPKAMGLEFELKPFTDDEYTYKLYLSAKAKHVQVNLYRADTLLYDRSLLEINDPKIGLNEGKLDKTTAGNPGNYLAIITLQLENGTYETYQSMIQINP